MHLISTQGLHIKCKLIQIIPTQQPNQILIHKPTHFRLVIPKEVVIQSCFKVGILVSQAERLVCAIRYLGFLFQTTPVGVVAVPQQIAMNVGTVCQVDNFVKLLRLPSSPAIIVVYAHEHIYI